MKYNVHIKLPNITNNTFFSLSLQKMKNIWSLLPLFFLIVNARNDTTTPSTLNNSDKDKEVKVEPTNISALYIGDLLRTKPKEVLETSGSVHQPVLLNQDYHRPVISAPVAGRSYNYKAHGGHEYVETQYIHPSRLSPESRAKIPIPAKRIGTASAVAPGNVLGHLLTVKPVRVIPLPRNSAVPKKAGHYPNDDCSKSGDHSYSSEEKPYAPEQPTYRRAKQIAPEPQIEYRSPQRSYPEDDRSDDYSSQSDPSSGTYNSKTYPSDTETKSHSSGSYTKSVSKSTSRTVTPNRPKEKVHVIPTRVIDTKDYETAGPAHGNQDIVVYKVNERPNQGPSSTYPESSEKEYPPSNYESDHKSVVHGSPYSQHPSEVRKPRKQSYRERPHHSTSDHLPQKDVPQQYGPPPYENDRGNYEQSSYTATDDHRYRDQNKQSNSYVPQEPEYAPRPDSRGKEHAKSHYQSYQHPQGTPQYEAEQPQEPQSRKRQRNPNFERPSGDGREDAGYRSREPQSQGYSYPHEQQLQSSRPRKERPQSSYEGYASQEPHTESVPQTQAYERNHPALRPSEEKQLGQYAYEATPHQEPPKSSRGSRKRQYRESSRSARSPERHIKSVIVEGRAHLPGVENQPVIMVSKESKPYVSRSVSYSRSAYNMDEEQKPEAAASYNGNQQQRDNPTAEGRQNIDSLDVNYPMVYKPFNSEYPASYANDPHHTSGTARQYPRQGYEQPQSFEQPNSYEENPGQYPSHGHQQSYDHSAQTDDSYEQGDGPVKKNKNHHYISNIEGYKDEYSSSEPLNIDDAFFEKYGISKKAKVIVATPMNPNLFVADGTKASEGGYSDNSGPVPEQQYESNFKQDYNEDSYNESPEEFGAPRQIPGSFDELVKTNPTFLRKLPHIIDPADAIFNMDASFDDAEFRNVEQKGFVVSQGPREIVQQHGDGVSRIVFNMPKDENKAEASKIQEYRESNKQQGERMSSDASTVQKKAIKKAD